MNPNIRESELRLPRGSCPEDFIHRFWANCLSPGGRLHPVGSCFGRVRTLAGLQNNAPSPVATRHSRSQSASFAGKSQNLPFQNSQSTSRLPVETESSFSIRRFAMPLAWLAKQTRGVSCTPRSSRAVYEAQNICVAQDQLPFGVGVVTTQTEKGFRLSLRPEMRVVVGLPAPVDTSTAVC